MEDGDREGALEPDVKVGNVGVVCIREEFIFTVMSRIFGNYGIASYSNASNSYGVSFGFCL